jgi:hypothetical protein
MSLREVLVGMIEEYASLYSLRSCLLGTAPDPGHVPQPARET